MTRLKTERLWLRPITKLDLPFSHRLLADFGVMEHALYQRALSLDEANEFLEKEFCWSEDCEIGLAVLCLKGSDEPIGFAGLLLCNKLDADDVEFGFVLDTPHHKKGYATEIGKGMIRYGLEELGRPRVLALVNPSNAPSRKVLEEKLKMGYLKEVEMPDRGCRRVYQATTVPS